MCHARGPTRRFEQLLEIYLSRKRRVYCPWPRHDSMSTTMIPLHAHNHGQRITASCLSMDTTIYYSQDIQEHTCGMFSSLPGSRNFFPYSAFQSSKGDLPNQDPLQLARLHFWKGVLVPYSRTVLFIRKNALSSLMTKVLDESTWRCCSDATHITSHFTLHRSIPALLWFCYLLYFTI